MKEGTIQFIFILWGDTKKAAEEDPENTRNILDVYVHFAFLHLIKLITNISLEDWHLLKVVFFCVRFPVFRVVSQRILTAFTNKRNDCSNFLRSDVKGKFVLVVTVAGYARWIEERRRNRESDKGKERWNCADYWQNFNLPCLGKFVQLSSRNAANIPIIENPRKNTASLFSRRTKLIAASIRIYVPYLAQNTTVINAGDLYNNFERFMSRY